MPKKANNNNNKKINSFKYFLWERLAREQYYLLILKMYFLVKNEKKL